MRQKQSAIILLVWLGVGTGVWREKYAPSFNPSASDKPSRQQASSENLNDCPKPGDEFAIKIPFQRGEGCWDYDSTYKIVCSPDSGKPKLHLDTHCYDFGNMSLNKLDTSFSLGISNLGNVPLTITGLLADGTQPINTTRVALESCEKIALNTCMRLTRPGRFKLTVLVACEQPCLPDSFTLYATGVVPILNAEPERLDFTTVLTGEDVIKEIVVRNVGEDTLVIGEQKISTTAADSVFTIVSSLPRKIFPGKSSTVKIRFAPNGPVAYEDTLIIHSNSYLNQITQIVLKGQGFRGPVLKPSFLAHSFNNICPGQSARVRLEIHNHGNEPLVVDSLSSNNPDIFPAPPFADTLMKGESREVWLEYWPREWSSRDSAQITIHAQADTAESMVTLFGTTPQFPGILVPNDTLRFAATPISCRIDSNSFTLINNSACSLYVDTISAQPPNVFTPRLTHTSLAPNERKTIWLDFTPSQADTFNGTLKLTYRFGDTNNVALFGIGQPGAKAELDDTSHDFGALCLQQSATWSFTLKNNGYCPLSITSVSQSRIEIFTVYPQQETIHPQEAQKFTVKFTPRAETTYVDTLWLATATGRLDSAIILHGEGLSAQLTVDKSDAPFAEVWLDEFKLDSLILTNHSSNTLTISDIELGPLKCGFKLEPRLDFPFKLPPKADTTFTIKFAPLNLGDCIDTLKIVHDAICARDEVVLSGKGVAAILLADTLHDFDSVQVQTDTSWYFTLENIGNISLKIDTSSVERPQNKAFDVAKLPDSIEAQARDSVKIIFQPTTLDTLTGSLVFHSNAYRDRRHVLRLRGVGVDKVGPKIVHSPAVCVVDSGAQVSIKAEINEAFSYVKNATLYYRAGGMAATKPNEITMQPNLDEIWEGIIPASEVGVRGLEYWFAAQDSAENPSVQPQTGFYSVSVKLPNGISKLSSLDTGSTEAAYRMISVPLIMFRTSADSFRQRIDFTSFDDKVWRLFDYHNGNLIELTESSKESFRKFDPGRAFWLITTQPNHFLKSGSGRTVPTSAEGCYQYAQYNRITLEPGWNMIANPFPFTVGRNQLQIPAGEASDSVMTYDGCWKVEHNSLRPWEGYAIKANQATVLSFNFQNAGGNENSDRDVDTGSDHWTLQLIARSGNHEDAVNYLGVRADARAKWDRYDLFDPPTIGGCVNVAFPHFDWAQYPDRYAGDFRTPFASGEVWEFEVKSNLKDSQTTLSIKKSVNFPSHFGVYIYDKNRQALQNLRENANYTFNNLGELLPGRFELIIGTPDFVQSRTTAIANNLPDEIQLYQNFPNPFNQETIFSFYLPQAAPVTLKVFDVLGREVRVLSEGRVWEQGRQFVRWEGEDHSRTKVSSGVYILALKVNGFIKQRRIVFIE